MLPTGRRPTCSASSKTCATVSTGRSPASSVPAPRIRHGLWGRILSSSTAVVMTARSSRYAFDVRFDVLTEQPAVKVHRARTQSRPLRDPRCGIVAEPDLPALGIGPIARCQLPLDQHECLVRVTFSHVRFRSGPQAPVWSWVADLIPAGRQLAHVAETPVAFSVRHYATPLMLCRRLRSPEADKVRSGDLGFFYA